MSTNNFSRQSRSCNLSRPTQQCQCAGSSMQRRGSRTRTMHRNAVRVKWGEKLRRHENNKSDAVSKHGRKKRGAWGQGPPGFWIVMLRAVQLPNQSQGCEKFQAGSASRTIWSEKQKKQHRITCRTRLNRNPNFRLRLHHLKIFDFSHPQLLGLRLHSPEQLFVNFKISLILISLILIYWKRC